MEYNNRIRTFRAFRAECRSNPKLKKLRGLRSFLSALILASFGPLFIDPSGLWLVLPVVLLLADSYIELRICKNRRKIKDTYIII